MVWLKVTIEKNFKEKGKFFVVGIYHFPLYTVHRVGRTGRAGNEGFAFTFITKEQVRNWCLDLMKMVTLY